MTETDIILVASAAVFSFLGGISATKVIACANSLSAELAAGVTAMLSKSLSDADKEKAIQKAALKIFGLSFSLTLRLGVAVLLGALPLIIAHQMRWVPMPAAFRMLLDIWFITGISTVLILAGWLAKRLRGKQTDTTDTSANSYSAGERILHALAFTGAGFQRWLSRMEDRLYRRSLKMQDRTAPIFITSLARGGTTALLNALANHPQLACHVYRDMPFIHTPILWQNLSGKRHLASRERDHGDGLHIDLDSPEAFDEIFWQEFWPDHYQTDHIKRWSAKAETDGFSAFFDAHMRKIRLLRRKGQANTRYIAKNNAHIARLALLARMFEGSQTILALRDPAAHAASLYRQHKNFKKRHQDDSFNQRYMADIGHFEFGELHRPLNFDLKALSAYALDDPNYWLAYWISAFAPIHPDLSGLLIVSQDRLRAEPNDTIAELMAHLKLPLPTGQDYSAFFRSEPDQRPDQLFDHRLLQNAREIYARLNSASL